MPDDTLFPDLEVPADPLAGLSAGARLTARQKADVAAGRHPLTGAPTRPELGSCGDCRFRRSVSSGARAFPKCAYGATGSLANDWPRASRGQGTDVRAWWPACSDFKPRAAANNG